MQVLTLITAFGALQSLLLGVVLAFSRDRSSRLLAVFALSIGLMIGGTVVMNSGAIRDLPHLSYAHVPFNFLVAPFFYLFARSVVGAEIGKRTWEHALPAMAIALSLLPFYAQSGSAKIAHLGGIPPTIRLLLLILQGFIYLGATFLLLRKQDRALWVAASVMSLTWLGAVGKLIWSFSPMYIPAALAICAIVTCALFLRTQFVRHPKYRGSTLSPDRADRYTRRLAEAFERDKLFLDPSLTLDRLSERLSIPAHHVSQLVNQRLGTNFSDWINRFRVEEVKRRLSDGSCDHLSIVAIGEDAGFRSKSAFNAAFRRLTAMTPSEYRRRCVANRDSGRAGSSLRPT